MSNENFLEPCLESDPESIQPLNLRGIKYLQGSSASRHSDHAIVVGSRMLIEDLISLGQTPP